MLSRPSGLGGLGFFCLGCGVLGLGFGARGANLGFWDQVPGLRGAKASPGGMGKMGNDCLKTSRAQTLPPKLCPETLEHCLEKRPNLKP